MGKNTYSDDNIIKESRKIIYRKLKIVIIWGRKKAIMMGRRSQSFLRYSKFFLGLSLRSRSTRYYYSLSCMKFLYFLCVWYVLFQILRRVLSKILVEAETGTNLCIWYKYLGHRFWETTFWKLFLGARVVIKITMYYDKSFNHAVLGQPDIDMNVTL